MRNLFLVLSGLAFYASAVTKGDKTSLQETIEHLVNYTVHEALEQLDLDNIANTIVDTAYKNHTNHGNYII